jgi:uncharacterized cupredoxin-like copper-binding protein
MSHLHRVVGTTVIAGLLLACGRSSEQATTGNERFIDVVMRDIAYSPDNVDVKRGETLTFVFHNTGKVVHDAFLGDEAAQAKHELEMSGNDMAGMNGTHHDDSGTTVQPGQVATLTHTFTTAGSTIIGCHEPGHYQAGMRLTVRVR